MASVAEIEAVRLNTNEPDDSRYSDEEIGDLVDQGTVNSASAFIWRRKASGFSELVTQSEAGASASFSDLFKNAKSMADYYENQVPAMKPEARRAKVHPIERST